MVSIINRGTELKNDILNTSDSNIDHISETKHQVDLPGKIILNSLNYLLYGLIIMSFLVILGISTTVTIYAIIGEYSIEIAVTLSLIGLFLTRKIKSPNSKAAKRLLGLNMVLTALLWASLILLTYGFTTRNYQLEAVMNNVDNSMSPVERFMATWASRQGVMLLWGAIMSTITTFSFFYLFDELENSITRRVFSITAFFNTMIVFFIMSVHPGVFSLLDSVPTNGFGLIPSLKSFWMEIHPPIAFLAYSSFIFPYAYGVGILSSSGNKERVPRKLHWLTDFYMLLGWMMTTLFIIAGSIWGYEENWSGFWNWDPVEIASLVLWVAATLYFHVKSQVSDNHSLRYVTATLGWIAVAFASFIIRSAILAGVHSYSSAAQSIVFGVLLSGSVLGLVYALLKNNEEVFPDYLFDFKKHKNKPKFLTFWAIVGVIVVNTVGLIMQIMNALINSDETTIPYVYYIFTNGILLFSLGILLVFCEIDYNAISKRKTTISFIVLSILGGIFSYFAMIRSPLTLIFVSFLLGAMVLLMINLVLQVKKVKNYRKVRPMITHILVVFMIISYIGVDYNSKSVDVYAQDGEMVNVPEFDLSVIATRRVEGANYYIDVQVWEHGGFLGTVTLSHELFQGTAWNHAGWVIKPLNDYFLKSLDTSLTFISEDEPILITIKQVPMANYFRVLFFLFCIATPFALYSSLKRRPRGVKSNLYLDNSGDQ